MITAVFYKRSTRTSSSSTMTIQGKFVVKVVVVAAIGIVVEAVVALG